MHILGALIILAQLYCAWDAISKGKDRWVFIILLFPVAGIALYIFMEALPHVKMKRAAQGMGADIMRAVDPTRELRRLREAVEISGSVKNRHLLAAEMIRAELYDEAIEILKELPTGVFADDPNILMDLAHAYFLKNQFHDALSTLDRLKKANPDFRDQQAHLLYARTMENLGRWEEALNEYTGLQRYFSGMEAKCRMGLLLQKMGHTERANTLFEEIVAKAGRNSREYYNREKEWILIAQRYVK
ncbi:MAG: tetratricopeptide repeat protein [Nitrospinota bacterium]|nr:tetratricopeptide repeat protein [Nitrospinota bacterium]